MDFFIIANAWSAGLDNPTSKHRIAMELTRRGHRVLWVEGSGMRAPSIGSGHDRLRMVRKVLGALRGVQTMSVPTREAPAGAEPRSDRASGNGTLPLWVVAPLFIPLPRLAVVRRLNGWLCAWILRFWGWRLGFRAPTLINYVPVLADAMGRKDGVVRGVPRTVYHCVDRWDAFAMYDSRLMAALDRQCCERADLVIASSQDLAERCRRFSSRVHLIPHGVDYEHFAGALDTPRRPDDLPVGRVAGFFGLLSEWLDQDLLCDVARRLPDCAVVLIGKADVAIDKLLCIPNIHVLGPRPFQSLPSYIGHFDVGMIPFVVNDLTRAVNPIKLREMLSAGCPVVSTDLPAVRDAQVPGVVVASTSEAFATAVEDCIRHPVPTKERRRISAGVANETWSAKVDEILALLRDPTTNSARERPRT